MLISGSQRLYGMPRAGRPTAADRRRAAESQLRLRERRAEEQRQAELQRPGYIELKGRTNFGIIF